MELTQNLCRKVCQTLGCYCGSHFE